MQRICDRLYLSSQHERKNATDYTIAHMLHFQSNVGVRNIICIFQTEFVVSIFQFQLLITYRRKLTYNHNNQIYPARTTLLVLVNIYKPDNTRQGTVVMQIPQKLIYRVHKTDTQERYLLGSSRVYVQNFLTNVPRACGLRLSNQEPGKPTAVGAMTSHSIKLEY